MLKEPLLHFLLLGAAIYIGVSAVNRAHDPHRIVVGPEQTRQIIARYQLQYGEAPDAAQLNTLIDRYAQEEILYREGVALGLDRDDEIVRRRIVQKVEFLQQDVKVAQEPKLAELQAFYESHRSRYAVAEKVSFTHIYFSPDIGGDAAARARAEKLLTHARDIPARAPERGDRFPDVYDYSLLGRTELNRLFGESELTGGVLKAPVGEWSGPYRSGYGWHLVRVTQHEADRTLSFAEARDRVELDFIQDARDSRNTASFAKLAKKYSVVRTAS
jgi:peptidyl-prolyl cis-trans isomerase C